MSSSVSCKLHGISSTEEGERTHDKHHQPLNTQWMENVLGGTLKDNELGSIFLNGCPHRTCSYSQGVKQPKRNTQRQGKHILSNVKLFPHLKLINYNLIFQKKKFDVWFFRMFTTRDTGIWFSRSLWCEDQLYRICCDPSSSSIANLCIIQKCDP